MSTLLKSKLVAARSRLADTVAAIPAAERAARRDDLIEAHLEAGYDRGAAELRTDALCRMGAGKPVHPAILKHFRLEQELFEKLDAVRESESAAFGEANDYEIAKARRDEVRLRLDQHRNLRAKILADVAEAEKPARVFRAMRSGILGEQSASENLRTFSANFIAARQDVAFLATTIAHLETELDQREGEVATLEKQIATAPTSTPAPAETAVRSGSADTVKPSARASKSSATVQ